MQGGEPAVSRRVELLGCPLDEVTMEEALARCEDAIAARDGYFQHMSVNAAKLVALHEDRELRTAIEACGLVTADGQSVVWASRLLGGSVPERVAGIDLMQRLCAAADEKGYRIYVLGARREVLDAALERLRERYPRLTVAGSHDGYYDDSEATAVCEEIRAARADVLFVAMSSPRKEYFLGEQGPGLGVPFAMGVGGSVDVIAGVTRRAPRLLQRLGLEWAYRLAQEPRRLARRYLGTNFRFAAMVLGAALSRRGSGAPAAVPAAPAAAEERTEPRDQAGSTLP
jgi:N-acetylglucosaminyldiphosphoundecaprenol N-acetyl-beta-D-mannosaminyltransferase